MDDNTIQVPDIVVDEATNGEFTTEAVVPPITPMGLDEPMSNDCETRSEVSIDDESSAKTLCQKIHELMKMAQGKFYIPRTDLIRVTSDETIRQFINEDTKIQEMPLQRKEAFIRQVQEKARTLFAILVYARVEMSCLKKLLDSSLGDESLPLDNENQCHKKCGAQFQDLLGKQGRFMAPVFETPGEHKILRSYPVLPIHFVSKDGPVASTRNFSEEHQRDLAYCGSGAYSRVYRVRIHPDHHKLSEVARRLQQSCQRNANQPQDRDCLFALKEFKDRPQIGDHKFEQERKILDEIRKLSSEHIVVHYVTWTQNQHYYMLFPYADCNLRQYMEQQQFGGCTKKNNLWFLSLLRNLADALRNIHNITEGQSVSSNLTTPNQELRKVAWHHDIKPENILFFRGTSSTKGMFKIADFGSGKVHTLRSGSANTKSPSGTVTYEPPEALSGEGATSRPYDIWSLGCVILELLLWAVFGFDSVQSFAQERRGRSFPDSPTNILVDDAFWEMKGGCPVLRHAVKEKLRLLEESVLKRESQHFKEVVELIWQMLECNPQKRIVARTLWNRLDGIFKQKEVDLSILDDDSIPKLADPDQSALPRLSHPAHDHSSSDIAILPRKSPLPILSHPTGETHLRPPPFRTESSRSGGDRH